jgi:polyphosphate:AMP phosphotransferase
MLDELDLSRRLDRDAFKAACEPLALELGALQRRVVELGVPVLIVVEGWSAAGKGSLIARLIEPLDPRGFSVHCMRDPTPEEARRPFLWRFWTRTPPRGRIAVFDRSWYRTLLEGRVDGLTRGRHLREARRDILAFERQLVDDGALILKLFLHISRREQSRRLRRLERDPATAWRVTRRDWELHKRYGRLCRAAEDMAARTSTRRAPWHGIEAEDGRFAALKAMRLVVSALRAAVRRRERGNAAAQRAAAPAARASQTPRLRFGDRAAAIPENVYRSRLEARQKTLWELENHIYRARLPVVIVYEGWDAAGKGGNIRRLTQKLDPRGYDVVPVAAPDATETSHHYLWRFWREMPKDGHLTVFDRSWYGRVLVERVEGFCREDEWRRAYREINELESHLTAHGTVLLKFWLQISPEEQLRRFRDREREESKRWKITPEDWRNRRRRPLYEAALADMLARTTRPGAPWIVVPSDCKRRARLQVMDAVIRAVRRALRDKD